MAFAKSLAGSVEVVEEGKESASFWRSFDDREYASANVSRAYMLSSLSLTIPTALEIPSQRRVAAVFDRVRQGGRQARGHAHGDRRHGH